MKHISITLPDELAALVQHEAQRSATSVSEVIPDAIAKTYLGRARKIPFAAICDDPKKSPAQLTSTRHSKVGLMTSIAIVDSEPLLAAAHRSDPDAA